MVNRCIVGDCREEMRKLDADSVDAIITDPPYHLTTGKKGGNGPASVNENSPYGRARIGTGFMGMKWDGGGVAFDPQTWVEALRVAKPGAHLLAFGGTRTFHRLWCAVEDAGWEIRDTLMWLHGEGFPKSLNVSKAIDRAAGAERQVIERVRVKGGGTEHINRKNSDIHAYRPDGYQKGENVLDVTAPATDAARQWEGWGTALKPAFEPILMARKPLIGTVAENLQEFGTGALNIDACRIAGAVGTGVWGTSNKTVNPDRTFVRSPDASDFRTERHQLGRWPANVLHDGSDEVVAMFPANAGALAPVLGTEPSVPAKNVYGTYKRGGGAFHADSGSAARFFWCPKASKRDRNEGLKGMPRKAVNWSSGEQSPGTFQSPNTERENENFHPTVKPTELMRYLCRLVTPPGGTILDIMAGSCSTGKAAILEGFNVICIDENAEYIEIGRARMAWAEQEYAGLTAQQGIVFA